MRVQLLLRNARDSAYWLYFAVRREAAANS
jgi:hypothetical protein